MRVVVPLPSWLSEPPPLTLAERVVLLLWLKLMEPVPLPKVMELLLPVRVRVPAASLDPRRPILSVPTELLELARKRARAVTDPPLAIVRVPLPSSPTVMSPELVQVPKLSTKTELLDPGGPGSVPMIANPDTSPAPAVTVTLLLSEPSPTIRVLVPTDQVDPGPVITAELLEDPPTPIQEAPLLTTAPLDTVIELPWLSALPTTRLLATLRMAPEPVTMSELLSDPSAAPTITVATLTEPGLVITSDPPAVPLVVPI